MPDEQQREHDKAQNGEHRKTDAPFQRQIQKIVAVRHHAVFRKAQHFFKSELGLAGNARRPLEFHLGLFESHPGGHAAQKAVVFGHGKVGIDGFSVQKFKIAHVCGNVQPRGLFQQFHKQRTGRFFEKGFALALFAFAVHDFVAFFPFIDHEKDGFGRVLQVDVDVDDGFPLGFGKAAMNGCLLTEIAAEVNKPHAVVFFADGGDEFFRTVAAAVVDVNNLKRFAGLFHHGGHRPVEFFDAFFLVEHGDDDRILRILCHGSPQGFFPL